MPCNSRKFVIRLLWRATARGENPAIEHRGSLPPSPKSALNQSEANAAWLKAQTLLNNFLWNPDGEPVELVKPAMPADSLPSLPTPMSMRDAEIDSLIAQHPELQYYALQQDQWEVEERWRREQLKPELALNTKPSPTPPRTGAASALWTLQANLKWG
ncbi:MAG: hypothetical protein U0176_23860 [Bacteroidia bacterium]